MNVGTPLDWQKVWAPDSLQTGKFGKVADYYAALDAKLMNVGVSGVTDR